MWYETKFKYLNKPHLNNSKSGSLGRFNNLLCNLSRSLGRFNNLLCNLSRNNQLETYDDIIREQQKAGIVKTVDRNTSHTKQ